MVTAQDKNSKFLEIFINKIVHSENSLKKKKKKSLIEVLGVIFHEKNQIKDPDNMGQKCS